MNIIVTATSKGQITLPAKWRNDFQTNKFLLKAKGKKLEVTPLSVSVLEEEEGWETIFDADRDTGGKGIDVDRFIKALKKTL